MEYTEANKKREMANKMVTKYSMKGKPTGYAGGMKQDFHGKNSGKGGSMSYPMAGKRETATKGQKAPEASEHRDFSRKGIYDQNGPDRHTA